MLPGATVTVAGPALIQPRVAVTSETGTYRVPELPIGTYSVTFELAGFRTTGDPGHSRHDRLPRAGQRRAGAVDGAGNRDGHRRQPARRHARDRHQVHASTSRRCRTSRRRATRGSCSSGRPASSMDRANVGGNQSGQQSGYISRGASTGNNKWSIDGVDITDMSATGASPIYYDFDMLEEMQVTTGGADVTQQTGGVGINLVTKSGTDRFKGSAASCVTDEKFQADNITDELRAQGAGSGAPIQNIQDYGFDVGGPIIKGKLWYWGSYGTQDIKVGVVGFYKNDPTCRPGGVALNPRTTDTETLRGCLETDLTTLNNYNWKMTCGAVHEQPLQLPEHLGGKGPQRARRAATCARSRPPYRQKAVSSDFGTLRLAHRPVAVLEGRATSTSSATAWLVDVMWAHLGNNFTLDFHEDALRDVQPRFETTTSAWGAFVQRVDLPPPDQQPRRRQQLLPAGDARRRSLVQVRLPLAQRALDEPQPSRRLHRCALHQRRRQLRRHLARPVLRVAPRHPRVLRAGHLHAQPPDGEPRLPLRSPGRRGAGRPRAGEPALPAADAGDRLPGRRCRRGVERLLAAHRRDLRPHGRRPHRGLVVVRDLLRPDGARPARRASSPPPARCSCAIPWTDTNGDAFVQPNEVNTTVPFLSKSAAYDPANPTNVRVAGARRSEHQERPHARVHRRLRPPARLADGLRRQLHLAQVRPVRLERSPDNWTSANYRAVSFTPTGCPAGARCETGDLLRADVAAARRRTCTRTRRTAGATSTASK